MGNQVNIVHQEFSSSGNLSALFLSRSRLEYSAEFHIQLHITVHVVTAFTYYVTNAHIYLRWCCLIDDLSTLFPI